jgi:glycosyltransferase involved in cell wall biosynthesis
VVVPLRWGTGTRLKALEAMAAGRPLVGTTVGLEGLGVIDGIHGRLADDADAFAAAAIELLRDDELARRLGESGRTYVEQRFGWDRIGDDYVALISELTSERRRPVQAVTARVSGTSPRP